MDYLKSLQPPPAFFFTEVHNSRDVAFYKNEVYQLINRTFQGAITHNHIIMLLVLSVNFLLIVQWSHPTDTRVFQYQIHTKCLYCRNVFNSHGINQYSDMKSNISRRGLPNSNFSNLTWKYEISSTQKLTNKPQVVD